MFFSKQEILNLFNAYATQMTFFFIIASFISLIMYIFLKRKMLVFVLNQLLLFLKYQFQLLFFFFNLITLIHSNYVFVE